MYINMQFKAQITTSFVAAQPTSLLKPNVGGLLRRSPPWVRRTVVIINSGGTLPLLKGVTQHADHSCWRRLPPWGNCRRGATGAVGQLPPWGNRRMRARGS